MADEPDRWHGELTLEPALLWEGADPIGVRRPIIARFYLDERHFASVAVEPLTGMPEGPAPSMVVLRVDAHISGYTVHDRITRSIPGRTVVAIEDIAKWVGGDGKDPTRVALADGIRQGLPWERP